MRVWWVTQPDRVGVAFDTWDKMVGEVGYDGFKRRVVQIDVRGVDEVRAT